MEEWEVVIFVFQNESYSFNRKCGAVLVGNIGSSKPWAVFRDGTGRRYHRQKFQVHRKLLLVSILLLISSSRPD